MCILICSSHKIHFLICFVGLSLLFITHHYNVKQKKHREYNFIHATITSRKNRVCTWRILGRECKCGSGNLLVWWDCRIILLSPLHSLLKWLLCCMCNKYILKVQQWIPIKNKTCKVCAHTNGNINVVSASISAGSLAPNEAFGLPDTMHSQAVL